MARRRDTSVPVRKEGHTLQANRQPGARAASEGPALCLQSQVWQGKGGAGKREVGLPMPLRGYIHQAADPCNMQW